MTTRLPKRLCMVAAVLTAAVSGAGQHPNRPSEDRIHRFETQEVMVDDFPAEGWILDIGGGGEGIIGQLKGTQVVAIDISRRELEDAPPGPLKIVMDAADLKFLDGAFETATCFFTLMYMDPEVQSATFGEVFRVLAPGARFLVWDAVIPTRLDPARDIALFPLRIRMPDRKVETGYGTPFPEHPMDVDHYVELASVAGFEVESRTSHGRHFHLVLRRP